MLTETKLGDGVQFSHVYQPCLLVKDANGRRIKDLENQRYDREIVRLWRYDTERRDVIPIDKFWSELETLVPEYAGIGTGIFESECVWRAEWEFPICDAIKFVSIGATRMSDVGSFTEYSNKIVLLRPNLTWERMI